MFPRRSPSVSLHRLSRSSGAGVYLMSLRCLRINCRLLDRRLVLGRCLLDRSHIAGV